MALIRCPSCDTFVRAQSIDGKACPFCPTAVVASRRNPIPGVMLAAAIAVAPGCKGGSDGPGDGPVYGIAPADASPDAQPADAMPNQPDAGEDPPIYGVAPDSD